MSGEREFFSACHHYIGTKAHEYTYSAMKYYINQFPHLNTVLTSLRFFCVSREHVWITHILFIV